MPESVGPLAEDDRDLGRKRRRVAVPGVSMNSAKFDYLGIKTLAEELGRPVSTLYALSANNDPFYIAPARAKAAAWFAEEWRRLKIATGWHYRRIHYVFVSQDGETAVVMLSGLPYENTLECWADLCEAARDAIALELVPFFMFRRPR